MSQEYFELNNYMNWIEMKWNDEKKNHRGIVYSKVCDMKWTAIPQLWCSMIVVSLSLFLFIDSLAIYL